MRQIKLFGHMFPAENVTVMRAIIKEIHPDSLLFVSQTHALCFWFNI